MENRTAFVNIVLRFGPTPGVEPTNSRSMDQRCTINCGTKPAAVKKALQKKNKQRQQQQKIYTGKSAMNTIFHRLHSWSKKGCTWILNILILVTGDINSGDQLKTGQENPSCMVTVLYCDVFSGLQTRINLMSIILGAWRVQTKGHIINVFTLSLDQWGYLHLAELSSD